MIVSGQDITSSKPSTNPEASQNVAILKRYMTEVGMGFRRDASGSNWNGSTLFENSVIEYTAHELGHYLVATKERRKMVEYGWCSPSRRLFDMIQEEREAAVIGLIISDILGEDMSEMFMHVKHLYRMIEDDSAPYGYRYFVSDLWDDAHRAVRHHVDHFVRWLSDL
jgi:hypothetical protein